MECLQIDWIPLRKATFPWTGECVICRSWSGSRHRSRCFFKSHLSRQCRSGLWQLPAVSRFDETTSAGQNSPTTTANKPVRDPEVSAVLQQYADPLYYAEDPVEWFRKAPLETIKALKDLPNISTSINRENIKLAVDIVGMIMTKNTTDLLSVWEKEEAVNILNQTVIICDLIVWFDVHHVHNDAPLLPAEQSQRLASAVYQALEDVHLFLPPQEDAYLFEGNFISVYARSFSSALVGPDSHFDDFNFATQVQLFQADDEFSVSASFGVDHSSFNTPGIFTLTLKKSALVNEFNLFRKFVLSMCCTMSFIILFSKDNLPWWNQRLYLRMNYWLSDDFKMMVFLCRSNCRKEKPAVLAQ